MKYSKPLVITSIILGVGILGIVAFNPSWSKVKADAQTYDESFTATLTPEQDMIGTSTMSTSTNTSASSGTALFDVTSDNSMINYVVNTTNLSSPFSAAHLHCAPVGQTGQIIVPLMLASSTNSDVTISGSILASDILPAAATCNPNITTLAQLIQAMREGQIYVNVHTQDYPMGEVRGQLMRSNQIIDFTATSTDQIATSTDETSTSTATTTDTTGMGTTTATSTSDMGTTTSTTTTSNPPSTSGWYYVFVQPDAYYKIQGSSIQFTGSHFAPGETVNITLPDNVTSSVVADSSGNFTTSQFTVPYILGQQTYTFMGNTSQLSFPVGVNVGSGSPWIDLSSYYAPIGSSVTISGHQFGGNEDVTINWSGSNVGTAHTDAQGNFSFTTTVPSNSSGQTTVSATGVTTHMATSQSFSTQQ